MKGGLSRRTISYVNTEKEIWGEQTYSIVADANSRGNVRICPQTALRKVETLLFQVLELVTSRLPLLIPTSSSLLKLFNGGFIFVAVGRELNLGLLKLGFVFALFLSHHHMSLRQISFDAKAVLFITIACLHSQLVVPPGHWKDAYFVD